MSLQAYECIKSTLNSGICANTAYALGRLALNQNRIRLTLAVRAFLGKQKQQRYIISKTRQETDMHKPAVQVFITFTWIQLATDIMGIKSSIKFWLKKG